MYDIDFFREIDTFKRNILSGGTNLSDGEIFSALEARRKPAPYIFNLETTNNCNMSCVMCPRTELMTRKITHISDEAFEKVIRQISPHPPEALDQFWKFITSQYGIHKDERSENAFYFYIVSRCVTLHGYGEPIIDPNITKRVEFCSARNIPTYFSCVPANIRHDKIISLMEAGLDVIKFSIDSLSDEKQKQIRGKNNNYSMAVDSIKKLIEYKRHHPELKTKFVVTMVALSSDLDELKMQKEFVSIWRDYPVYCYVKSQDNRWYWEDDESMKNQSHYKSQYCEFPWLSLSIMSNGAVVPCSQDYDAEMVMGHIQEQSLEEIWNSEKYKAFRRAHITGEFQNQYKCKDRCDLPKLYQRLKGKC